MTTPILRRSRVVVFAILAAFGLYYSGYAPSLSRASIVAMMKPRPVEEIHGFLHFVTRADKQQFDESLDVSKPLDMAVYAQGEQGIVWQKVLRQLDSESPVIVFSKTYCPYSKRAKTLLEKYELEPKPTIIEVDLREDDMQIKRLLTRLTGQGTFPNVFVRGKSLGGSDDVARLHANGQLRKEFEEGGVIVRGTV